MLIQITCKDKQHNVYDADDLLGGFEFGEFLQRDDDGHHRVTEKPGDEQTLGGLPLVVGAATELNSGQEESGERQKAEQTRLEPNQNVDCS